MKNIMLVVLLLTGLFAHGADKKVSDLPLFSQGSWLSTDLFQIADLTAGVSKKTTVGDFDGRYYLRSTPITIAQGGTGATTQQAAINALAPPLVSGTYLRSNGANSTYDFIYTGDLSGTVGISQGGTGQVTKAAAFDALSPLTTGGDLLYGGTSGAGTRLANGSAGNILSSSGTTLAPAWTSATYPLTTTANQLLYSSATNTIGGLSTAATSALVTNSSSVPSLTSGTTANRVLRTDGTTVSFAQVAATTDISGALPIANGGTNNASLAVTAGGVLYTDGTKLVNVGAGTSTYVLTSNGASAPTWNVPGAPAVSSVQTSTYAILTSDYDVLLDPSGGAFTATLPTAVGATGKIYKILIVAAGNSTKVVSLATTSSQTIGGYASSAIKLSTLNETLSVISDGTNWRIENWTNITPLTAYTPTGAWSANTTYTGKWKRVGDVMQLWAHVATSGAPTSASLTINLPSGFTIDTAKLPSTTVSYSPLRGTGFATDAGNNSYAIAPGYNSATSFICNRAIATSATGPISIVNDVNQAAPFTFGSGDSVDIYVELPITNWTQ